MGDILFSTVERYHSPRPWGRFLDAGTGVHSLKWLQTLNTESWTAITADNYMRAQIEKEQDIKFRPVDRLLVGNWMDSKFCETLGEYDTIFADYLIGAVDGFSPYEQDTIIKRLRNHVSENGRLYVIGMNPIPDHALQPAEVITEVRRARDACIQLAGHRPYREFPLNWMIRHLESAHFKILKSKSFTILHSEESILRQLRVAQSKLDLMPHMSLRQGMELYLRDLGERVKSAIASAENGRIPLSFDYVIAAEPTKITTPIPMSISTTSEIIRVEDPDIDNRDIRRIIAENEVQENDNKEGTNQDINQNTDKTD
eukprot:gene19682-25601_t